MGRIANLGHPPIDSKVCPVHKAAFVTGQEKHRLSLFNGFSEATSREMDLSTMPFGLIVSQPVLEEGSAAECEN